MNCPKCDGQILTANKVGDLEVDHCNECGGLWLDKSELGQLVEAEAGEVKHLLRGRDQTNANARRGNCPRCKKKLLRVTSAMKKQVTVDSCQYNGGMPGVLKYFIDMLEFPESFEAKPVCFVGLAAGAWGALRPVEQLQQIFGYRNAHIYPKRVFLPAVYKMLNDEGEFTDEEIAGRLEKQAEGFIDFVKRVK